jgi:uncharacterized cupredoxin-like copper-binding protein
MTFSKIMLCGALLALAGAAGAHGAHEHHDGPKEQMAWGLAADAGAARRTIVVTMGDDMRFTPDHIAVRQGETVRIVVKNAGAMLHEFVLGNERELKEHAALMRKFPNMQHDDPSMANVAPGQTGEIVWTFNRPGHFEFACLQPGHYEAGMRGTVDVAARR